jgi:hypothetical protein
VIFHRRTENPTEEMKNELEKRNGFIFNTSRRTANYFSCDALLDFLQRNDLSHVVRAHEVQHVGFKVCLFNPQSLGLWLTHMRIA